MEEKKTLTKSRTLKRIEKFEPLFFWLRWFYPSAKGISFPYLLYCFPFQKIFRINGRVKWPVHFTSRVLNHKKIKVGNRSAPGLNAGCYIQGRAGIKIGDNCRFGPNIGLISSNHDINNYDQWIDKGQINIGDNVWIGMNSVVMPGIKIGNNVVIAANSVVTLDIPANSIAAGNPCKVIRKKEPYEGNTYKNI